MFVIVSCAVVDMGNLCASNSQLSPEEAERIKKEQQLSKDLDKQLSRENAIVSNIHKVQHIFRHQFAPSIDITSAPYRLSLSAVVAAGSRRVRQVHSVQTDDRHLRQGLARAGATQLHLYRSQQCGWQHQDTHRAERQTGGAPIQSAYTQYVIIIISIIIIMRPVLACHLIA